LVVFTEGPALRGAALCRLVRPRAVRAALLGMTGCIPRGVPARGIRGKQKPVTRRAGRWQGAPLSADRENETTGSGSPRGTGLGNAMRHLADLTRREELALLRPWHVPLKAGQRYSTYVVSPYSGVLPQTRSRRRAVAMLSRCARPDPPRPRRPRRRLGSRCPPRTASAGRVFAVTAGGGEAA
jgi:hypothetical protein